MSELNVAVIAQDGLALEALLEGWADSPLAAAQLSLVTAVVSAEVQTAFYDGRPLAFQSIEDFDFSDMALVIVLEKSALVESYKDVLKALSCPVLGFMSELGCLEPQAFDGSFVEGAKVVGLAQPAVSALKHVLSDAVCESVDVTAFYPVSFYGKAGVSELASQTARLLNAQALEYGVFQTQMTFNYFPMACGLEGQMVEESLISEIQQAFDIDDVHVLAMQMPVFHGVGLSISVVLADVPELNVLIERWKSDASIVFQEGVQGLSNYDVLQIEGMLQLGRVQQSKIDENRLDLWVAYDESKFGIGKNLINVAEFLLKHYL